MPSSGKRLMCFALLILSMGMAGWRSAARAQVPKADVGSAVDAPSAGGFESDPARTNQRGTVVEDAPVFYVRDENGRLIPLLGFKYEEILEFIEQKKQGGAAGNGYSLQQLVSRGQVREGRAELNATWTIRLEEERWVEIPLLGRGAVLAEPATHQGPGDYEIRLDADNGSYVARLRGPKKSEHRIAMRFLAPVRDIDGENRIEFEIPSAAASQLSLDVPEAHVELTSHEGAAESQVKSLSGGSRIELWGLSGRLRLGWKALDPRLMRSAPTLEAIGQILARIDSHSVQFDTLLTVRSRRTEFDRIHVKLPPGSQYTGTDPSDGSYTIVATSDGGAPVLEVRTAERTVGPIQIRVQAERPYDVTRPDESLQLAGFEVVEALPHRQWGHVAVAVQGDWQVTWGNLTRARQIAELPVTLQQPEVVAGFEYFGQPASLPARIAARKTRISVEPEYVYSVSAESIGLEARLRYTIRGAKAFALEFELPGWEIDELGPENVVDTEVGLVGTGSRFRVPLVEPTTGSVELTIRAHRALSGDTSRIEFVLPVLQADVQGPATVVVLPDDNVQLRPLDEEIEGLLRQSAAPDLPLPARQQPAWFYRAETTEARFVADVERLPQAIAASAQTRVDLRRDEVIVEQLLSYQIDHEPATSVWVDVPARLLDEIIPSFAVDGKDQAIRRTGEVETEVERFELPLGKGRLGNLEVTVRYRLPQASLSPVTSTALDVPLVMPARAVLQGNQLSVAGETGIQWDVAESDWMSQADASAGFRGGPWASEKPAFSAPLSVVLDRRGPRTTVVQRAWVQTWLSHGVRQDRVVYRFKSTEEQLQVSLPMGAKGANVEASLDGEPLVIGPQGALIVELPARPTEAHHLLEIRYQLEHETRGAGTTELSLPSIEGSVWTQRMYWQLIVPRDCHLVTSPDPLTPEFSWGWNGTHWHRQSSWDQAELEAWSGASSDAQLPQATNRYLFSTTGKLSTVNVWLAPRWQIVFVASLVVLACALVVLHAPGLQKPGVVLAASIALTGIAVLHAEAALLLVQAGLLGVVLGMAAALLRRVVLRRHRRGMVVRSAGSSISERDSTRRRVRTLEPARPGSDIVPATDILQTSASDSQSG